MTTKAELAKHLDLLQQMISKLVKQGVLPVASGRQLVDIDACRLAYINFLRRAAKFTKRDGTGDVQEERARLTKAQADERELMVAKLRGELIDADDVQRIWSEYIGNCRAKLLSLPTKAAHHVLSVDNYAEAEQIIKDLVYEALEEMVEHGISESIVASFAASESDLEATTES